MTTNNNSSSKKSNNNSLVCPFQETQKYKPLYILAVEWDSRIKNWICGIWNATEAPKRSVFLHQDKDKDKDVNIALKGTDVRVTSDKGLVCLQYINTNYILFNPFARRSVKLPDLSINLEDGGMRTCFMGYCLKEGEFFNILSVTKVNNQSVEYHLLTIKNDCTWTRLDYQPQEVHFPDVDSTSVCIDGIIYYGGYTQNGPALMKFNLHSESFTLIQLPTELLQHLGFRLWSYSTLVAFHGKPAIGGSVLFSNSLRLWTLEPSSSSWTETVISTEPLTKGIDESEYTVYFNGAAPCQEKLIFSILQGIYSNCSGFVVYYNPMKDRFVNRLPIILPHTQNSKFVWDLMESDGYSETYKDFLIPSVTQFV